MTELCPGRVEVGPVTAVERLTGGMIEVTAELPRLAGEVSPGQFAQLRCGAAGPLLRRPFSVAWTDGSRCSFVFAVVGQGTARLAELRPGDPLDALGPLGRGFTIPDGEATVVDAHAICISGGLGCAPFPLLVRALRAAGCRVVVLSGAATADRLYPAERFHRGDGGVEVREATDDGSRGARGQVVELLEPVATGASAVYACGPNPMLEAVAGQLATLPGPGLREASLEAPMGCGFGVCLGCALPVTGEPGGGRERPEPDPATAGGEPAGDEGRRWALCCREGPVMELASVDWAQMRSLPPPHVA